jgi:hypothetical protein
MPPTMIRLNEAVLYPGLLHSLTSIFVVEQPVKATGTVRTKTAKMRGNGMRIGIYDDQLPIDLN